MILNMSSAKMFCFFSFPTQIYSIQPAIVYDYHVTQWHLYFLHILTDLVKNNISCVYITILGLDWKPWKKVGPSVLPVSMLRNIC